MNRQNLQIISNMKNIIQSRTQIHEFDLVDELDMKITTFRIWKSYLLRKLEGFIEYDKPTKMYRWKYDRNS